ncbi:MAG: metallophosphoesterase [Clostridia bacterium]|nr:metallophosphoesterase [Clostridia bacterium]MBQ9375285.1 metallophosphoesterase [Ruminococcus sp.]
MLLTAGILIALAVALGVYCVLHNKKLVVTRYELEFDKLPKAFSGKKILQISDLHKKTYGENYGRLIDVCKETTPDYIVFTGDLYSRSEVQLDHKAVLMKRLQEIAPVYYVTGNHELDFPEKTEYLMPKIEEVGVTVLRNAKTRIYSDDEYINIYGAEFDISHYINEHEGTYSKLPAITEQVLDDLLGQADVTEFNLLLAHTPFPFECYAKWGADLTFSGHCHGGAIRLPFVGGLLSPERKFFPKYSKGVYNEGSAKMVVSAGLGKFRINNPPELVLVTLK